MAQTTYTTPGQEAPGEIYQQAAQNGLGELAAVYKPRFTNSFLILGIALAITIIDIAAIVVIYEIGFIVYYLVAIPIIAIIWAINTLGSANLRVYIFTTGFIRAKGRKGEVVRWDQVQAIWEKVTRSRYSTSFTYTVQRADGQTFKQGSPLQNSRDMGLRMMREISKLHLPAAQAAYRAGQTLSFGRITVNQQGLSNGKVIVPWNQLSNVAVQSGKVYIEKDGYRLNWSPVRSAEVPNLSVLIALVKSIVQGQK